jgi:23S rRNA (adenine2503-C2)-methyltransferase
VIEAVSIPFQRRVSACLSSQLGCKFSCSFCASGLSGFKRNLTSAEMLDELLYLKNHSQRKEITHIVFMGTGEPLDNYENVLKAIRIINCKEAFNVGWRRITISTSGVIPGIKKLAGEGLQIELSVSLHAPDDATRSAFMPINKKYPLKELISACAEYIRKTNRQITFEYVLIKGINSDLQKARNLSTILQGLNCKVNLIPVNPVEDLDIQPPNKLEVLMFRDYLAKHGLTVTLRRERGQDINAACGQLRLRYEKN